MAPKLETEDLTRVVDGERVVDRVSLAVRAAEVLTIVGPSGAGKSSFLRLLNRLDEPTEGTVFLDGTNYRELDPGTLRRRVGLIPQQPALRPGTVFENATLAFRVRDEPVDDERIERLLAAVELDGYAERDVERLSGGERQRVSIVRTLANEPEVLLLDEPTSSLDDGTESRIETLLAGLIDDYDLTCVLVTHDTDQARRLGDRIARFEGGELARIGRPDEVVL
ncbi:ATP-binding cassette domain-containing protein [Halovivax sp.]|uniref:ABC transporter ATP-binding protein n=1 Tax=Halovivax sp. TaxID=1935978 RepID=UPI0025C31A88|nr:ATP-binding cassette domain-containing protein [Halovivax sp.]